MTQVFVNIVTWNSRPYLSDLLNSLRGQTFRDFSVLVIDNASTDGVVEFLRSDYPEVTVLRNVQNLGFAGAHNQGIKYALHHWQNESLGQRYILVTNPDIILTPQYLERLLPEAEGRPQTASLGGKLLRIKSEGEEPLRENIPLTLIDSTGLMINRNRRVVDRGAGENDQGQYDAPGEVFGVSGALALYRASALEAARLGEEYFDEHFFAYKEDADLAWRLCRAGFENYYLPEAVAYHFRRASGKEKAWVWEMLINRRQKSALVNYYSYRNHLWLLVKNEEWLNFLLDAPWILSYEAAKLAALIFFEPKIAWQSLDFWRGLPQMLAKRQILMTKNHRPAREMRKWFR